jgi:hypothetical protein
MEIISNNKGGLANRIKSWVSTIKISKRRHTNYKVFWQVLDSYSNNNHILNCKPELLFSNDVFVSGFNPNLYKNENIFNSHCLYIDESDNISNNFNTFDSKCNVQFCNLDEKRRDIDFMYNQIPENVKIEYISYFNNISLNTNLQDIVDIFSDKFNENTVSVHIRSWNRNAELGRRSSLFQIDKFEKEMKNRVNNNQEVNFYLASDSSVVINHFSELNNRPESPFYQRIITYPRTTTLDNSRDFPEGIQEDLVELYLLSKNSAIIGSHFSTYTEVSWWLAGCPEDITIL